ncbi:hypothetical protein L228DRAFT_251316 [Xylona heveae TC161]|uniref:Uncharacterized protein n=1 Tax=Xylona heveae (strain CBS 132557 / TC161) TaxID=1328760 RepID=A0A164ZKK4_XYLHT|nr:hypothetical protein L228DRAFT_251316 [Xylona heveae TC161]KZF19207.1 hypothetical protein L228DRAFT_251316 [Xylona heveae TC161]
MMMLTIPKPNAWDPQTGVHQIASESRFSNRLPAIPDRRASADHSNDCVHNTRTASKEMERKKTVSGRCIMRLHQANMGKHLCCTSQIHKIRHGSETFLFSLAFYGIIIRYGIGYMVQ